MIARARRFFYIYSYYIYIPVSSSLFLFILKSKVVLFFFCFLTVVKLLSGCSSLLFQKMTSLPKKGSRRQSSSPSVCRSQKERKKERKKKSDPSIQKFFVRTVFFSVLKIIHYKSQKTLLRGIIIQYCCR